jgi:hypothetical protein
VKGAPEAPRVDRYTSRKGPADLLVRVITELRSGEELSSPELSERFVNYSRPPDSPTHALFGDLWDDKKAAAFARLDRARELIASVQVYLHDMPPDHKPVQWVPVVIRGGITGRVPIREVMADHDVMAALVARALADAEGWMRRHYALRDVAALEPVFEAIETAKRATKKKTSSKTARRGPKKRGVDLHP